MTGQDLITTTIIGMENFLANNVPFEDTDDIITFITNVKQEEKKYFILDYIDEPITEQQLFEYLINHVKPEREVDAEIVRAYVDGLDAEMLSRVYYKNQLQSILLKNSWFREKLNKIIKAGFSDKPAEKVKDDFENLRDKILDFVYYDFLYEDRYKRTMNDKRRAVVTIDTDSCFNNLDPHIQAIRKSLELNLDNSEEESTLVNMLIAITTSALERIFWTLTTNMGLVERAKPIINMKNEFVYKTLLLTPNKKNYCRSHHLRTWKHFIKTCSRHQRASNSKENISAKSTKKEIYKISRGRYS